MSLRKRRAPDELLPTSRPSKVPRSNHAHLQSAPENLALVHTENLGVRWVQLAEEIYTLVGETAGIMFSSLYRNVGSLLGLPSPRDDFSLSQPSADSQSSHSSHSRSPSVVCISPPQQLTPLPEELPPPPRRRTATNENAIASSSSHQELWPESGQENSRQTGLLTPSPSQTSSNSLPTSLLGPHTETLKHQYPEVEAALRQARRRSSPPRKQKPPRAHIFDRKHKQQVQEYRIKSKEEMEKELYDIRRRSGFTSDIDAFRSWLSFREQLERMQRLEALQPSPSLVNLHAPAPFPELARSQSAPHASDGFIFRALRNAKETLKSKPPPSFSPSLDKLRLDKLVKSQQLEDRLRPKKKPLPASLSAAQEAQVDELLRKKGVVSKCVKESVSDRDLVRLRPGSWLNDEIINFYGQMILSRSEACGGKANKENAAKDAKKHTYLNVHYFSTFFWAKLTTDGYDKGRLAKWTKKFDIFSKDVVLIPINHGNAHWTGAAINFRRKRIESYDSMGMPRLNVFKALRTYLDAEHRNKKKTPFDFTDWEDYSLEDTPQQENGYDCGVFTCQFLESLSRGEESFAFTQANMAYLRRRMIWEIGHAKLWDDGA